jgi:hypothetical protein
MDTNRQAASIADQALNELRDENDEAFLDANELRALILEKEATNEQKRLSALETQDRFLWDLSLAVKRCLVEERGQTSMGGHAIAQVTIPSLLEIAEAEDPQPSEWGTWIEQKLVQQ